MEWNEMEWNGNASGSVANEMEWKRERKRSEWNGMESRAELKHIFAYLLIYTFIRVFHNNNGVTK
jgi:hypothetical protein